LNFRDKLRKIDDMVQQNIFKATYNSIMPEFFRKPDPVKAAKKKRRLVGVNDFASFLDPIDKIYDHKGYEITKSGTKLDGMLD